MSSGISSHYLNSYYNSSKDFQFDWIKIDDNLPVQLGALIQLSIGTQKNIFMFSGVLCEYVDGKNRGVLPPFPMIKYNMIYMKGMGRSLCPAVIAQVVDDILEPAFVVPVNGGCREFLSKNTQIMAEARFLILPMQFLMRDGYTSMDFTKQLNLSSIRTDDKTRQFLQEDKYGKKAMYADLIKTLRYNGNTKHKNDDIILQDLFLRSENSSSEDENED
jgi:hypothetical protein